MKLSKKDIIDMLIILSRLVYNKGTIDRLARDLTIEFTQKEAMYLMYCLDANDIDKRNYNLLRRFLEMNITENEEFLYDTLSHFSVFCKIPEITLIYDLGAGHTGWAKILERVFGGASVVLVDKVKIESVVYPTIEMDINEWLDGAGPLNSSTLVFMSEYLHCKTDNIKILHHKNLKNCNIIINEVTITEKIVNERLLATNGGLMASWRLAECLDKSYIDRYSNFFDYYLCYGIGKGR